MAQMMVGAEVPRVSLERTVLASDAPLLELDRICANDDLGLGVLADVSFGVAAGEIVGIAGVSGNGQEELVEVLAGQRPSSSGGVKIGGKSYRPTRAEMREQRVRLLPEAPLKNACVAGMSVAENIGFRSFDVPPCTDLRLFVKTRTLRQRAQAAIREFAIKTPSADAPIAGLSGGNVQRAVLARELTGDVAVLVAANPCFGLDFAAVSEIRTRIMAARNAGSAVLLVSSDLEEIFALSDRILVMSEGRVVYEARASDADIAEIGRHMGGGHA
jgi:simple sugar transport system ATP-binding protein